MYRKFEPPRSIDLLPRWKHLVAPFDLICGYTYFGQFFLRHSKTDEIAILYPQNVNLLPMGFLDWDEFQREVLEKPEVKEELLQPEKLESVQARLGPLEDDQVYIAQPYQMIGGRGEPETYGKGDLWVYADLVAQTAGI